MFLLLLVRPSLLVPNFGSRVVRSFEKRTPWLSPHGCLVAATLLVSAKSKIVFPCLMMMVVAPPLKLPRPACGLGICHPT